VSARRQARATLTPATVPTVEGAQGVVPRCLAVGCWVEVWAPADPLDADPGRAARRRFTEARRWWLLEAAVPRTEWVHVLPLAGPPWSSAYLLDINQPARLEQRLDATGCTVDDLPVIRLEVEQLVEAALLPTCSRPRYV